MSLALPSRYLLVIIAWFIYGTISVDVEQPIVKTSTATFRGKRLELRPHQLSNECHRSVSAFTRIPYAEPPVGQLRFAYPVGKVIEGDFDATRATVACPQAKNEIWEVKLELVEDCLTLDVFVPDPKSDNAAVMMWIHGGGYHIGAGSTPGQLPAPLAAYNDVIVVTINYRLGPLGFLATGDGSIPANLGLLDQRQALIWIQDNIEAFGGDPKRVTIFGESAGSTSVNLHLLSTMSAGLFSRAIMQSGAVTPTWSHHNNMSDAVQTTRNVAKALQCDHDTSSELVKCLRKKPVEDFIAAYEGATGMSNSNLFVRPVADGQFLLNDPIKMVSEESFNKADIMIGCMRNEGSIYTIPAMLGQEGTTPYPMNHSTFRQLLARNLNTQDIITLDLAEYIFATEEELSNPDANFITSATKFIGDAMFLCPTFDLSQELLRIGRNVYTYMMPHIPSYSIWGNTYDWLGAAHAEDIPYVFGTPFMSQLDDDEDSVLVGRFGSEEEVAMSLQIMRYWANFAKTGDPNLSTMDDEASSFMYPIWSKSTPSEPNYKELTPRFENHAGRPDAKECYFMKKLVPALIAHSEEISHLKMLLGEKMNEDSEGACDSHHQSCTDL